MGAALARKLVATNGRFPAAPGPDNATIPPQTLSSLRAASSPKPFPLYRWQEVERDGKTRTRSVADEAGRPAVLNLWATWCEPCGREMPSLARLAAATRGKLDVLPVSIDRGGAASVQAFFASHGIEGLPVLIDPSSSAMAVLGLTGLPTTFLIGADGALRARFEGAADWNSPEALAALDRVTGS